MKTLFSKKEFPLIFLFLLALPLYSQTFTEQTSIVLPGITNGSASWGDYDNDGDNDILLCGYTAGVNFELKIFRNNGAFVFAEQAGIFSPSIPVISSSGSRIGAKWTDFDNDGYLDIIFITPPSASTGQNSLMIYRNQGNNTFILRKTLNYFALNGHSFDCGDYDNDGDADILLTTHTSTRIYQNLGSFNFNEQKSILMDGLDDSSVRFIDYDIDGDPDIFLSGQIVTGGPDSRVYRNEGNNTFTRKNNLLSYQSYSGSIDWSDYNGDGYPDLLMTGSWSPAVKNNLGFGFSLISNPGLQALSGGSGKWGDLNNDGKPDIIMCGASSGNGITKIFLNNGNDSFTELTGTGIPSVSDGSMELFDYDNDNDLDILIWGNQSSSYLTRVYRNNSVMTNALPEAPAGLVSSVNGNYILLKWKRAGNDNTPSGSLSYNVMIGSSPGGIDIVAPNSSTVTGLHKVSGYGNTQLDTFYVLKNIKKGTFYWKVQSVDASFKGGAFSAGSYSFTYSASIQATALNISGKDGTTADITWSRGNGQNCIVFLKEGNSGISTPVNNTTYSPSSVFKSGSQIGASGWYCIAKGSISSASVTGLKANTDYIVQVIEYDGSTGAESYNAQVAAGNPLVFKTASFTEDKNAVLAPVSSLVYEQTGRNFWIDFDNDNDLDILLQGTTGTKLYRNDGAGIFTLIPYTFPSRNPVSCADYNNDGLTDIAICGDPTILIRNTGNMTFSQLPGTTIPASSNSGSIDWGDYDNDGDADVLLTGQSSAEGKASKIFRNNGDGTFTEQQTIQITGVSYGSCKWLDYNNDGLNDFIVSGYTNDFATVTLLYKNSGGGQFAEQKGINFIGMILGHFDIADYDDDGFTDIAMTGQQVGFMPKTAIYHNNANVSFSEVTEISLPQLMSGTVKWGDYDNDGDADLVLAGYEGMYTSPVTRIFTNNGNGNFSQDISAIFPGAGIGSASWGDYDNDGDLDLLVSGNTADEPVSKIFRNDTGVTPNTKPAAPAGNTATVDRSDVTFKWKAVRTDKTPYKSITYNLRVGTAAGGINIVSPYSSETGSRRIAAAGNMQQDTTGFLKKLPFGNYYWSVQAVDNSFAGGNFSSEGTFSIVPVQASNLSARIISNNEILLKWKRGNGDRCAVFCKQTSTETASPVNNTTYTADNQYGYGSQIGTSGWYCVYDGRLDSVLVTGLIYSKLYSFHIFEYTGNAGTAQYFPQVSDGNPGVFSTGLFTEQTGISLNPAYSNNVSWGDYDNDGYTDLVVPGNPTRIYRNNGDNTFTEKTGIALTNAYNGSAAWGDYDMDGDLDLVITGSTDMFSQTPVTKIYRNNGSDVFADQGQVSLPALHFSSVSWGDYDMDGDIDLLMTGATGASPNYNIISKIFDNNNGQFTENSLVSLSGVGKGSARWIDYDNDGDLDISISGATDSQLWFDGLFKVYRNNGNRTFTEQTGMTITGWALSYNFWGDYDNDGDPDVMLTAPGYFTLYENRGNNTLVTNLSMSVPYQGACYSAWADYDNDGYLDFVFTNPGLDTKLFHNVRGKGTMTAEYPTEWFIKEENAALKSIGYSYISWVDYDNDGDLDLLMSKDHLPTKLFRNNLVMLSGHFTANKTPGIPAGTRAVNSPQGLLLKWDPVTGDETVPRAMTYNISIGTTRTSFNVAPSNSKADGYRMIQEMGNAQLDTVQVFKNLPSGKYYWKVQAVDQGLRGGKFSAVDSFEVKTTQAFFSSDVVCLGKQSHFTDQSVTAKVLSAWKWDFGDGVTSNLQHPVHIYTQSGTHLVKLTITDSGGTRDSLTKDVFVKPKPLTDFTAPSVCEGTAVTVTNNTNATGVTVSGWSWNFGDASTSSLRDPAPHPYIALADYTISLKAIATNGCADSITKVVTVASRPSPAITVAGSASFCQGKSVTLSATRNPEYTYAWKLDDVYQTGGTGDTFNASAAGNYSVEITNPRGNCMLPSAPVTVNVKPSPAPPVFLPPQNYSEGKCPGENPVRLGIQNVQGYHYRWMMNGILLPNETSSFIQFWEPGNLRLIVDLDGCTDTSAVFTANFQQGPEKPQIYAEGPTAWYLASSIMNPAYHYKWYYNGSLVAGADKYYYMANKNLGVYRVSVGDENGCYTKSDSLVIPLVFTEIDDSRSFEGLNIFPNPSDGMVFIELENNYNGNVRIEIFSQAGKKVMSKEFDKTEGHFREAIDMTGQAKGMYLATIKMNRHTVSKKILIE